MPIYHPVLKVSFRQLAGSDFVREVKCWLTRFLTRLLLVTYSLLLLKPVMPIVMDKLAHTFWRNVHFAVVHVENGKAHVHYELSREAKDFDKEKTGGKTKTESEISAHVTAAPVVLVFTASVNSPEVTFPSFECPLPVDEGADNFRPPRA